MTEGITRWVAMPHMWWQEASPETEFMAEMLHHPGPFTATGRNALRRRCNQNASLRSKPFYGHCSSRPLMQKRFAVMARPTYVDSWSRMRGSRNSNVMAPSSLELLIGVVRLSGNLHMTPLRSWVHKAMKSRI
jgi:hypothetical protein